jgi:hypothetical protein
VAACRAGGTRGGQRPLPPDRAEGLYAATNSAVTSGSFIGPAGRRQDSGTPKPARLPRGADAPAIGASLWRESERLTGVTFNV